MQRWILAPATSSVKTTARHTSVEFVDFLGKIGRQSTCGKEIHIVADNLSAHKPKAFRVPQRQSDRSDCCTLEVADGF